MKTAIHGALASDQRFTFRDLREQRDRMDYAQLQALRCFAPLIELQQATGVARGDDVRAGGSDVFELSVEEFVRHFRLGQVVNARAAATPIGFGKLDQLEIRNRPQQLARLGGDFLAVAEVAGFVVGHDLFELGAGARLALPNSDAGLGCRIFDEPFVDVLHLLRPTVARASRKPDHLRAALRNASDASRSRRHW